MSYKGTRNWTITFTYKFKEAECFGVLSNLNIFSPYFFSNIDISFFLQSESKAVPSSSSHPQQSSGNNSGADDVMVLLQTHERHAKKGQSRHQSDSDSDDSGDEAAKRKSTAARPVIPSTVPTFGTESKSECQGRLSCSALVSLIYIFV